MSESPISLRDETGIERFRGTQSPGGGSQPVTEDVNAPTLTVADGAFGSFSLFHELGATLLDYTDPMNPTFIEPGFYIYCIEVSAEGPQASGTFFISCNGPAIGGGQNVPLTGVAEGTLVWAGRTTGGGENAGISVGNFIGDGTTLQFGLPNCALSKLA